MNPSFEAFVDPPDGFHEKPGTRSNREGQFSPPEARMVVEPRMQLFSTPGAESVRCAVQNSTRPNPTNIANANPNPPTPADRVVPVHSWRLVIVPCGLILCASLVRFCLNTRSRVCALCS